MSTFINRPYFPPSLAQSFRPGARSDDDAPAARDIEGLALGEHWTTEGILSQARFLADYSADPKRHAAWLLALSACTANDQTTHEDMARAIDRGLTIEDASRIAVLTNSGAGAVALASLGVDWSTQRILPQVPRFANDAGVLDQPSQALIEHYMDPNRAKARYQTSATPVLAVEVALRHRSATMVRANGFLHGVLQSGLGLDTPIKTHALGLQSGHAKWLSTCIANRAINLVLPFVDDRLHQDTIDEALLACAMSYEFISQADDVKKMWKLADRLLELGADRDRLFSFSPAAMEALGENPEVSVSSARQWFIHGALLQGETADVEKARGPLPLPPAPGTSWGQWGLQAVHEVWTSGQTGDPHNQALLVDLLDHDPVPQEQFNQALSTGLSDMAHTNHAITPMSLDACLASKKFDLLGGSMSPADFSSMIKQLVDANDTWPVAAQPEKAVTREMAIRLWRHPRLTRLTALLTQDDRARFQSNIAPFLSALESCFPASEDAKGSSLRVDDIKRHRQAPANQAAAQLAFSDFLVAFESDLSPKPRARRTL